MNKFIINEDEKSRILGMHKSYGYTLTEQQMSDSDLQNHLAVLYIMNTQKLDKTAAEKYLKYDEGGYENFITGFDGQNEDFMNWLESMGLERGDVFIDNDNMGRVLNKLKSLKKL